MLQYTFRLTSKDKNDKRKKTNAPMSLSHWPKKPANRRLFFCCWPAVGTHHPEWRRNLATFSSNDNDLIVPVKAMDAQLLHL